MAHIYGTLYILYMLCMLCCFVPLYALYAVVLLKCIFSLTELPGSSVLTNRKFSQHGSVGAGEIFSWPGRSVKAHQIICWLHKVPTQSKACDYILSKGAN